MMAKQGVKAKMSQELDSLLEALKPLQFIFDARRKDRPPPQPNTITIKLNEERTFLCLEYNNNESKIEVDSNIRKEDYDNVRTALQNSRSVIPEKKWDKAFMVFKQQIINKLIRENKMDDQDGFLREFHKFVNELPEVPYEFIGSVRKLKEINFDDWDIEESEENDPRLKALAEIHKKILDSFSSYQTLGENYIEQRKQQMSSSSDTHMSPKDKENSVKPPEGINNIGIGMFNEVKISGDGNCFYSAIADQLEQLGITKKINEAKDEPKSFYTHQDLKELTTNYIKKNKGQEFGRNLEAKYTDPLHADPPSEIQTIDQYIELHGKEGSRVDNEIIEALARALDVILNIYDQDDVPKTYNGPQVTDSITKKVLTIKFSGNCYSSLVAREFCELFPLEIKFPKQSCKIKKIFDILNKLERGEKLDEQIRIVFGKLGLSPELIEKVKGYFNARSVTKPQQTRNVESNLDERWYTDDDMHNYGRVLEKHGVDFDTQFSNRLTDDGIHTLPSMDSLTENHPRYICYNIGGKATGDNSGMHWVAIFLVKRPGGRVTILYKDSKGDWNNSSATIEKELKQHYDDKVDFIRDSQVAQEDDSSCGPMTINNLEVMASKVKEINDEGTDGVAALIELFKGESGGIAFTTQEQVPSIRLGHKLQKISSGNLVNLKHVAKVDDLKTVITKLKLNDDYILMKDGKHFKVVLITEDGNAFYSAIADQLTRLANKPNNQSESSYTHEIIREQTIDYMKENREQEFVRNLEERLQAENTDPLHVDLPPDIHLIDQYVELHSKEGTWADCGIIGALAQAFDVTLNVYDEDGARKTYNASAANNKDAHIKQIINLQYTNSNHYNSLVDLEQTISKQKADIESKILKIDQHFEQIKDWGVDELKKWSREHKGKLSKNIGDSLQLGDDIIEAISVMDRANELATKGHRLRDTQKAAILIFMQTNVKGHVSQINTGEGKTTIVSVLAALKVMQGYKIHVITSNNVLASDGVKDKSLFYELLKITTADNNPDEKYTDGPRACYNKDVVYGSITSFQFDWLRDSFEQLKTLGGVDFNNVWVMLDEIDSLLIDQGGNIAKLSGPFPGMESLRYVYINIWVALAKTEKQVTDQILAKLKAKADELAKDSNTCDDEKQLEYEEYEDGLRESFLDEIKKQIKNQKDHLINKKILANHLLRYAEDSVERWVEHAFTAKYQYKENVEYKIGKDKDGENIITPVDNQNTGVSMKNTVLSNGLHQFLQIKHNLCLTYESLTSCYVSNLDYIKKYGSKLSGVTGTLGSKPERDLLGKVFNLEFSVIPPCKPNSFAQFPGKVSPDDTFVNDVAVAALGELTRTREAHEYLEGKQRTKTNKIKAPRAVLIVCASILDAETVAGEIAVEAKAAGLTPNILKYRDEVDEHITNKPLDVCDVVIATNLAGRGTDFKTSALLESNGGLHVIEAFLPCNKRVEDQGLGRTARQGNQGTGQIIVKLSEVEALGITIYNTENIDFDQIMKHRDELETTRVNDIAENKIAEIEFKGQLFNKFSSQYAALKEKYKRGSDVVKWIYVLRDLKENWAFWLEKQAYTAKTVKEIIAKQVSFVQRRDPCLAAVDQEYNTFLKQANEIMAGNISHNPFYSICLAERYLEDSTGKSNREKAKKALDHALNISKSSELLYSAYIKLFEIAIEDGRQILKRYKKAVAKIFFIPLESGCPEYKTRACDNLRKAKAALEIEHDYLEELIGSKKTDDGKREESVLASVVISGEKESDQQAQENAGNTNLFVKHLQARLVCLAAYKGNIESLVKQINGENVFDKPEDCIGPNDGVIIDSKVSRYLSKLDSQNEIKQHITERAVNELEYVGMSSVYQLRKIHDVHEEVIRGAQIQIGTAFALLASAAAFPVLLPVNGPLAGAMISEGITDIITALIQQGQSGFNKKDYIKGKVISYGISILTMGIGAIMSSTKILNKAMNACRSLATKLRSVTGPFAGICNYLAKKLDILAKYLQNVMDKIEFARKTAAEQAKHLAQLKDADKLKQFQQLQKSMKFSDVVISHGKKITLIATQSAIGAVKNVVISVAIEMIVIASLDNMMTGLKLVIKEKVKYAVEKIICEHENGKFENVPDSEINQAFEQLLDTSLGEDVVQVSKEIGLGILRNSSNWKMQLATLAFESLFSTIDIATCTDKICNKFLAEVSKPAYQKGNKTVYNRSDMIEKITEKISDTIYGKIVAITGKVVVTLPKALYRGYQEHKEKKSDQKDIAEMSQKWDAIETEDDSAKAANTKCAHDAVAETLGFDKDKGSKQLADATNLAASTDGASIEDTKQLFIQNGVEVTSCGIKDAQSQFEKLDSDRGVVCLSRDNGLGHVMPVTMDTKDNCLMVTENGRNIPLDQYQRDHGFTNAELIIPKGVNASTLQDVQHSCNLNRITRATHPIGYVGQDGGMMFGGEVNKKDKVKYKINQENYFEELPLHSMTGANVLRASEGVRGGHASNHLTHIGFKDKKCHTVFVHGKEQQNYLANAAIKNAEFQSKAREVQNTRERVVCTLPIEKLLHKNLPPKTKERYRQATTRESGAARNMKFVTFVIDPAELGSGRPYQMLTMYPVIKHPKP